MTHTDVVRPGQVWIDNYKPMAGRSLRVLAVSARHAQCVVLTSPAAGGAVGHTVRILLERMRPTSTGYALLYRHDGTRVEGGA
ncbi:DUF6354 family protein [Streptomyces luteolus]|uniref:DUF6354 family protein n=1 Tax=Streptomyces luteolus TaxID=3043615 RepID=A0ABT6SQQ8_9ACTN|nr:DUF6354 family protein [Streptomyces sp. B-S-A12]MDI3417926.1 DUF6354 family protein [Streptomyces sp. B-S-A12]